MTVGILNKTIYHPREIFYPAITNRSAAIICVKNSTNGSSEPKKEDRHMTKRLGEVGRMLGIPMVDFVIIGDLEYHSMADNGSL